MFKLIDLPFAPDALEPVISAQTLSFHHGKHLQGYVDNLNKLIAGSEYESMTLEEIIKTSYRVISSGSAAGAPVTSSAASGTSSSVERSIFNNAGQILNHNLYFTQFRPYVIPSERSESRNLAPTGALAAQIETQWGTLDAFKAEFEAKGTALFGSGWVWLASDSVGTLFILQCPNAGNPITAGLKPLLTFDVWEHAYYQDYQNRRAAHLSALWKILDWSIINQRYFLIKVDY